MVPFVQTSANEKTNCQRELAAYAVNPEVVCRDDDAQEGERRIQQHERSNPTPSGKWPHGKCAPTCPANVQARHCCVLV